jgi:hypothetical protein
LPPVKGSKEENFFNYLSVQYEDIVKEILSAAGN